MPVDELRMPGLHNISNALAAVAVGAPVRGPARGDPRRAGGLRGRRAPARDGRRSIDGVRFVNDSQGTQPDAVIAALRAFDPPIVLIAGGRDKGVDLASWRRSSPSGPPRPS